MNSPALDISKIKKKFPCHSAISSENMAWWHSVEKTGHFVIFKDLISDYDVDIFANNIYSADKIGTIEFNIILVGVENFSPDFISILFMLVKTQKSKFNIFVPFSNKTTYQIEQFVSSSYIQSPELKDYIFLYRQTKEEKIYSLISFPQLVISNSFSMPIYIDGDSFSNLFMTNIEDLSGHDSSQIPEEYSVVQSSFEETQKTLINFLRENVGNDPQKYNELIYYNVLKSLAILPNRFGVDGYTTETYYTKKIKILLGKLEAQKMFFLILFRLLISRTVNWKDIGVKRDTLYTDKLNKKQKSKVDTFVEQLDDIFSLCENIIPGIYEIAKNIIEHSSNRHGVIVIKIFDQDSYLKIKSNTSSYEHVLKYCNFICPEKEPYKHRYINISIIDDGEAGIILTDHETLKKTNKSDLPDQLKGELKKDFDLLDNFIKLNPTVKEQTNFIYNNYFNFKEIEENYFRRKIIKAIANFGLSIFTKKIIENEGYFHLNTDSILKEDGQISFNLFGDNNDDFSIKNGSGRGTRFNITFPIKPTKKRRSEFVDTIGALKFLPKEHLGSFDLLRDTEILLNPDGVAALPNKINTLPENFAQEKKIILIITAADHMNAFRRPITLPTKHNYNNFIFAFNLGNRQHDISELIRFLSMWPITTKNLTFSIIIYNVDYNCVRTVFEYLKQTARDYHGQNSFWLKNSVVLFYVKRQGGDLSKVNQHPLILLSSDDYDECEKINKNLKNYHNVCVDIMSDNQFVGGDDVDMSGSALYTNNSVLAYWDLLLYIKQDTIFELNINSLLQKEVE